MKSCLLHICLLAAVAALFAPSWGCGRFGFEPSCTACDDGIGCTRDVCSSGLCEHVPDSSLCPDGELCLFEGQIASCRAVSNLPGSVADAYFGVALESLDLSGASSPVYLDGDSGEIWDVDGKVFRGPGMGEEGGIGFDLAGQRDAPSDPVAVFSFAGLTVPEGIEVLGIGSNPLVLFARDWVEIYGTVDVGARWEDDAALYVGCYLAGPGGLAGGQPGEIGAGDCGGGADGGDYCGTGCTAGGGGGGHGGLGGSGGDGSDPEAGCLTVYTGGVGGGECGSEFIRPLVGGSGGGSGGIAMGGPSEPGLGGAGGGAIQIISLSGVLLDSTGIVTAPGGGGGGAANDAGGGGGGGAGGSILIESAEVILKAGSVLAANGGGGGSGDCT